MNRKVKNDIRKSVVGSKSTNFNWVQNGTRVMVDLWMYNFARNIPDFLDGDNVKLLNIFRDNSKSIKNHKSKHSAIVIGGGPSVYEKNHLNDLIDYCSF